VPNRPGQVEQGKPSAIKPAAQIARRKAHTEDWRAPHPPAICIVIKTQDLQIGQFVFV
jgi:hypothetical protein